MQPCVGRFHEIGLIQRGQRRPCQRPQTCGAHRSGENSGPAVATVDQYEKWELLAASRCEAEDLLLRSPVDQGKSIHASISSPEILVQCWIAGRLC